LLTRGVKQDVLAKIFITGEIKGFTGVDDPYEPPIDQEITLETVRYTPEENAGRIIACLEGQGLLI